MASRYATPFQSYVIQRLSTSTSRSRWAAFTGLFFLSVYFLTRTSLVGDTQVYVHDILNAAAARNVPALFEFGHILWRPFAYVIFRALQWADPGASAKVLVNFALLIPSLAGGLICALLFFQIAFIVAGSRWIAFVTAIALICTNSFLNYAESGSSYIPGLALFAVSVWLLMREPVSSVRTCAAAACALAGSILLWFPFITVAPGVLAIVLLWQGGAAPGPGELRLRVVRGGQLTVITGIVTLAVYFIAFRLGGHTKLSEIGPWIRDSAHGWHQTANAVRFVFGFPRSFLDLGNDGILFKRFLWHDPYARVSIWELVRGTLLKIAVFYAVVAYILWRLAVDSFGRRLLVIISAAALPLMFFAIVLFEPGSPERYLPLFPFAAMAIAFTLARPGTPTARIVLATLLILSASELVWSHSVWEEGKWDSRVAAEIKSLKPAVNQNSVVWVLLPINPLIGYSILRPLDPVNLDRQGEIQYLVETGMENARQWPRKFAKLSLRAWDHGGTVLVSNQVFASRPERAWNWTEGDVPGVRWTDFPAFFSRLQLARAPSGSDGFTEILPTPETRQLLADLAR